MRACAHTYAAYTEPMLTESAELNIPNKVYCDSSRGLLASQHKRVVAPDTQSRPPKPTTKQVHKGCTPNPALSMACQPWWRAQASSACVSGRTPESTVPPGTNDHNLSSAMGPAAAAWLRIVTPAQTKPRQGYPWCRPPMAAHQRLRGAATHLGTSPHTRVELQPYNSCLQGYSIKDRVVYITEGGLVLCHTAATKRPV